MNINREKNYKINASRIRNYFMSSNSGALKLAYENEAVGVCPLMGSYDWVTIHTFTGIKTYCWIYTDAFTNRVCVEYHPISQIRQNIKTADDVANTIPKEITYGGLEGTILYGTLTNSAQFIIEDIFFYRGKHVTYSTWGEKMQIYKDLFTKWKLPNASFKLPRIYTKTDIIRLTANGTVIPRDIITIKFFKSHSKKACNIWQHSTDVQTPQHRPNIRHFWTKADIRDDIYHLYTTCNTSKEEDGVGLALIPDFKTSIKMNALFRNIRENSRLDALEESDDEAEFENIAPDKYLKSIDTCIQLKYAWHPRWRKYYPLF